MNTRIISVIALALMTVGTASPVMAKEDKANRALHQEIKQERKDFRQQIQERLSEARKNHLKRWWENATHRLQKLIDREKKVADKIQERITKLKDGGRDVVQLQHDLDAAKLKIGTAQTALTDAGTQVNGIITTNTPKEALTKLHVLYQSVIEKIKEAHRALVKVLAATRGLSVTPTPTPTPTP